MEDERLVIKCLVEFLVLPGVARRVKTFFLRGHGVRDIAVEVEVPCYCAGGEGGGGGGCDIETEGGVGGG